MTGRPPHLPTAYDRRQVEAMAGYGIPEIDIAKVVGIDPKTLRRHYREELDLGHVKANSAVAQSLFRKATGDGPQSVIAAIFWAKTRMGWRETAEPPTTSHSEVKVVQRIILAPLRPGSPSHPIHDPPPRSLAVVSARD